jgi:uncharacterized protein
MKAQRKDSAVFMKHNPKAVLAQTTHRPWELPSRPWVMAQTWSHLLFAHWRIDPEVMRPLLPPGLTLETYDGSAWLGVVPFFMSNIRARFLPVVPGTTDFCELNVRTYVTDGKKPGVWFFSLDAGSPAVVWGARRFFALPYFNARMSLQRQNDTVQYVSHRTHTNASAAQFQAEYRPVSAPYLSRKGTLVSWLTERYCLYSADRRGSIYRGEIHHPPWLLQDATAKIPVNTMADAAGLTLPDEMPLVHYAEHIDVVAWYIERV